MAQTYLYKVRDQMGKAHAGQIEADSRAAAVEKLRQSGYLVTGLEEQVPSLAIKESLAAWGGITSKDMAVFCRQFSTMIGAGLPLLKCLSILVEQSSKTKLRQALAEVSREVESGSSLSAALNKHSAVFPPLMVAMIRAGETGGILEETLKRLAEHFEDDYELKEKIKNAATYPVIVLFIAVAVIVVMMAFVLPTFQSMLSTMGVELPLPTRILMAVSGFMQNYIVLIIILLVLAVAGAVRYVRTPGGKRQYDRFILMKMPVIRGVVLKIGTARLCRTLGTLVQSGVPIMQAIEVSEATTGNSVIVDALDIAKDSIREGAGLAKPLAATGIFSPMVTQMIAVGEETGALDVMLKRVAEFYEKEVKLTVASLSSMLEPVLVVFLGLVVGSMIISILLPLLKIYDSVGKF